MNATTPEQIARWIEDARHLTYALLDDLDDAQLRVPPLDVVNPLLWELGHVGWFQEKFALRLRDGSPSVLAGADALYDSGRVGHEQRWALELPDRARTRDYLDRVQGAVLDRLRQVDLTGNVWEWTSSVFGPYPGFEPGAYEEYSAPWFGTRRVLRGGAWATRSRLIRNTWRNYFTAERRDVFAGFRTCAVEG